MEVRAMGAPVWAEKVPLEPEPDNTGGGNGKTKGTSPLPPVGGFFLFRHSF